MTPPNIPAIAAKAAQEIQHWAETRAINCIGADCRERMVAHQAEIIERAIQAAVAVLATEEPDVARLEWLEDNMTYIGGGNGGTYSFFSPADLEHGLLRAAIDAARSASPRTDGGLARGNGGES